MQSALHHLHLNLLHEHMARGMDSPTLGRDQVCDKAVELIDWQLGGLKDQFSKANLILIDLMEIEGAISIRPSFEVLISVNTVVPVI